MKNRYAKQSAGYKICRIAYHTAPKDLLYGIAFLLLSIRKIDTLRSFKETEKTFFGDRPASLGDAHTFSRAHPLGRAKPPGVPDGALTLPNGV